VRLLKKSLSICCSTLLLAGLLVNGNTFAASENVKTYTTDADFSQGSFINLSSKIPDQLQLDDTTKPFNFIWVAVSTKGTVVKINTETGDVIGEYKTAPNGEPTDPSRTTVDKNGSVWVSNRAGNSVTRICLPESGLWIDKNNNGKCDTSTNYGDIKPWSNTNWSDSNGGVTTAEDECIINYVKVSSSGTRHVSVDKNNDVWVSGTGNRVFNLLDGVTGSIKRTEGSVGYGGYGGIIDKNDVIWSANRLLRWDTSKSLTGGNGLNWKGYEHNSYGLAIDNQGNVWNSSYGEGVIRKFAPDGSLIGTYNQGNYWAQGCVADSNGDIWVAHSLNGSSVGHLKNDGTYVGTVPVGSGPTGVAVDSKGKIWVTNYSSGTVSRIDPTKGSIGNDGVTRVGEVDFTSQYLGGNLYNYSDMTGSTLIGAPNLGSWSTVYDSGEADTEWGTIDWNGLVNGDGSLNVVVESSNDGINFGSQEVAVSGSQLNVSNGRYLKVTVNFKRSSDGSSPILYDLTLKTATLNNAPVLDPIGDKTVDANNQLQFTVTASDPDGDSVTLSASNLPTGSDFDASTGIFTWTPTSQQAGTYPDVHFEATDGEAIDSEDISITVNYVNTPPVVDNVVPSVKCIWPPNSKFVDVTFSGYSDPDGDEVSFTITAIKSDEPTATIKGAGGSVTHVPDADGVGTDTASLRAERSGKGNGRVYTIYFTCDDGHDGLTNGSVKICVPHDQDGTAAIDDGPNFDATAEN